MIKHNYYTIIGLPVQPCVDEAELKAKYLKLSSSLHPDRETDQAIDPSDPIDAALVNEAQTVLSHAPSRIRHLLALKTGSIPGNLRQVPNEIGDLFMKVGMLLKSIDKVIQDKPNEDASELSKVIFLKKSMASRQQIESMLQTINSGIENLQSQLEKLNADWKIKVADSDLPIDVSAQLTQIYHEWTFHDRWRGQLKDRMLELTV